MREIKFRVWDGSQMNYHVLAGKLGVFYASIDPKDTASVINTKYPENIIPMQFTGLKDKNGNEIYEGDKMTYTVSCGSKDGLIRTDKKGRCVFHAIVLYENGQFVGKKINGDGSLSYAFSISVLLNEVIEGNIYQ